MVTFRLDSELILREFEPRDAEAVFHAAIENYDHLRTFAQWISKDYSLKSARSFIAHGKSEWELRKGLPLGIFRGETFIGSCGFVKFDWKAGKAEIGYWITKPEEGKGIITLAVRTLIGFAFAELGLNRIEIRCSSENRRSSAIPRRLGFRQEALLRQSEFRDGRLHDFEIYGLLKPEWR